MLYLHCVTSFVETRQWGQNGDFCVLVCGEKLDCQSNTNQLNNCRLARQCPLDIRKRFFTERVVQHWNRLLRAVVTAPSLTEFKKCLDNTLGHVVRFWGGPLQGWELSLMILVGPSQLGLCCDSMTDQVTSVSLILQTRIDMALLPMEI